MHAHRDGRVEATVPVGAIPVRKQATAIRQVPMHLVCECLSESIAVDCEGHDAQVCVEQAANDVAGFQCRQRGSVCLRPFVKEEREVLLSPGMPR